MLAGVGYVLNFCLLSVTSAHPKKEGTRKEIEDYVILVFRIGLFRAVLILRIEGSGEHVVLSCLYERVTKYLQTSMCLLHTFYNANEKPMAGMTGEWSWHWQWSDPSIQFECLVLQAEEEGDDCTGEQKRRGSEVENRRSNRSERITKSKNELGEIPSY